MVTGTFSGGFFGLGGKVEVGRVNMGGSFHGKRLMGEETFNEGGAGFSSENRENEKINKKISF